MKQSNTNVTTNEAQVTKTLYPNLRRELTYRKFMMGHVASAANITEKLLAVVLLDGEKLSEYELSCVARELKRPTNYIKSPKLKLFGKTKRDKELFAIFQLRTDKLKELRCFAQEKGSKIGYWGIKHYNDVMSFCEEMSNVGTSTLARYYLAYDAIEHATSLIRGDIRDSDRLRRPLPRDITKPLSAVGERVEA